MGELRTIAAALDALIMLERRGIITTDKTEADDCCGIPRDADGFCIHRPHHQIYVPVDL